MTYIELILIATNLNFLLVNYSLNGVPQVSLSDIHINGNLNSYEHSNVFFGLFDASDTFHLKTKSNIGKYAIKHS